MKVWELIHELSKAPANSLVLINTGEGEKSFHINDTAFEDFNIEGFSNQYPVHLNMGREDK